MRTGQREGHISRKEMLDDGKSLHGHAGKTLSRESAKLRQCGLLRLH